MPLKVFLFCGKKKKKKKITRGSMPTNFLIVVWISEKEQNKMQSMLRHD
jgi:hypothetical protein